MSKIEVEEKILLLEDLKKYELFNILNAFCIAAYNNNLPIVLSRIPNSNNITFLTDFSEKYFVSRIDFNKKEEGFVFSPFIRDNKESILFFKKQFYFNSISNLIEEIPLNKYSTKELELRNNFITDFKRNLLDKDSLHNWYISSENNFHNYSKADFCNLVKNEVEKINNSKISKIVASGTFEHKLVSNFNPIEIFFKLYNKYPNAFVSFVSSKETGTWLGATPEILLKIKENELKTVSLAGTQKYLEKKKVEEFTWSNKEIEEQEIVSEYIEELFENLKIKDYKKEKPKNIIAGNVVHLQTIFTYENKTLNNMATTFLDSLHPTPAICGYPKNEALSFILEHELHKRSFYSGFLGTINIKNESNLFVNLRCMQLLTDSTILYLGCGLTKDSIPEKEWDEVQLKAQTLLSVF